MAVLFRAVPTYAGFKEAVFRSATVGTDRYKQVGDTDETARRSFRPVQTGNHGGWLSPRGGTWLKPTGAGLENVTPGKNPSPRRGDTRMGSVLLGKKRGTSPAGGGLLLGAGAFCPWCGGF